MIRGLQIIRTRSTFEGYLSRGLCCRRQILKLALQDMESCLEDLPRQQQIRLRGWRLRIDGLQSSSHPHWVWVYSQVQICLPAQQPPPWIASWHWRTFDERFESELISQTRSPNWQHFS